jgi:hypothetical protein
MGDVVPSALPQRVTSTIRHAAAAACQLRRRHIRLDSEKRRSQTLHPDLKRVKNEELFAPAGVWMGRYRDNKVVNR